MTATATEPIEVDVDVESDGVSRDERLRRATSKLRTRKGIPVDKWFQLIGGVLMSVGILAIVAGAYGAAHTAREWRQTPYVVSGGLLGLALVFVGGIAYLAYWVNALVQQGQRHADILLRLEIALTGRTAEAIDDEALVVAKPGVVHRASCPLIAGKDDTQPYRARKGLRSCPVCEPNLS